MRKRTGNGQTGLGFAAPRWADVDWAARVHHVRVAGGMVQYVEAGHGSTPVVLVHGLGGSWQTWLENIEEIAAVTRVIAVDLPGFGRSEPLGEDEPFAAFADVLAGLIELLDLRRVIVVGHSMGGLVACDLAARRRDLVARLVLVNAGGIRLGRWRLAAIVAGFTVLERAFSRGAVVRAFVRRPRLRRALVHAMVHDPAGFAPAFAAEVLPLMASPGFRHALMTGAGVANDVDTRSIDCPVLLVWGVEDRVLPLAAARRLRSELGDARLVEIDGAGHCPMFESPSAFNQCVTDFVSDAR